MPLGNAPKSISLHCIWLRLNFKGKPHAADRRLLFHFIFLFLRRTIFRGETRAHNRTCVKMCSSFFFPAFRRFFVSRRSQINLFRANKHTTWMRTSTAAHRTSECVEVREHCETGCLFSAHWRRHCRTPFRHCVYVRSRFVAWPRCVTFYAKQTKWVTRSRIVLVLTVLATLHRLTY